MSGPRRRMPRTRLPHRRWRQLPSIITGLLRRRRLGWTVKVGPAVVVKTGDGFLRGFLRHPQLLSLLFSVATIVSSYWVYVHVYTAEHPPRKRGGYYVIVLFFFALYWMEVFGSDVFGYLRNQMRVGQVYAYGEELAQGSRGQAYLQWHMTCWHYEMRTTTRHIRNGTRTDRKRHKVITHKASFVWEPREVQDASRNLAELVLEEHELVLVKSCASHELGDAEARAAYEADLAGFREEHGRDENNDFKEKLVVPGLQPHALYLTNLGARVPWWMNSPVFLVASLLMLSVPFRMLFYSCTHEVQWGVHKRFLRGGHCRPIV